MGVRSCRWWRRRATARRRSCRSGPSVTARRLRGCRSIKVTTIRRSCSPTSRRRSMRSTRSTSGSSMRSPRRGWPAGLYLAALYLREGGSLAGAAVSFGGDHRLVSEYVEAEFLARISRRHRVFLTRTPVLERMSGPLCGAAPRRARPDTRPAPADRAVARAQRGTRRGAGVLDAGRQGRCSGPPGRRAGVSRLPAGPGRDRRAVVPVARRARCGRESAPRPPSWPR
jgi:hypothetical protein